MKKILNHLFDYQRLSREEAREVLILIAEGKCNDSEIAAFLSVYVMRAISVEELTGFRDALLELCIPAPFAAYEPIDLCGTGGDGKNTFNISTLSSFVVAGAGGKVAKHGNYGVSSVCGSSNVMEHLGYRFTNDVQKLEKQLDQAGLCFLHAPLFHPAMKTVGPIRRQLGIKTFFNILGPMVNPAQPKYQLTGVFSLATARLYQYLYQQTNKEFMILHSLDGYDEISLTGEFKAISNYKEEVLAPSDLGLPYLTAADIAGPEDVAGSAKLFTEILQGRGTKAQNDVVVANSGMALQCMRPKQTVMESMAQARESLESGTAWRTFGKLMALGAG